MGFDPADGKVMVAADCCEKAPNSLNERLVASRLDGVVPEGSYAILALGNEIDAPPDHRRGEPDHFPNPLESVVRGADLSCVVRGTGGTNPVRIKSISDHRGHKGRRRGLGVGLVIKTPSGRGRGQGG